MPRNASSTASSETSTRASAHKRVAKSASHNAVNMLIEDHKKVKKLFKEFEKMKKEPDGDKAAEQRLVQTACAELMIHAQLEEEIFYPAMRHVIDDSDLLDEAEVEHATAKQLITELSSMQPGDALYDAKFTVLAEYVNHHVEEEEKEMFPKAKKAKLDLDELGEQLMERRQELREELGLPDESGEGVKPARATRRKSVH